MLATEAKPHWVLKANRSRGTKPAASAIRCRRSSSVSSQGHFVVSRPLGVRFSLAGPLAQFGRGGIVQDLATRLTAAFADNLQARLDGIAEPATGAEASTSPAELNVGGLFASVIWARIKATLASVFRWS